ncbi:hypothetical protein [Amycolatopsis sp. GM8]|uniref:hypothetical protein n=1 Tax=Amycolatopsis sp. GM8 TaxID=2896530 RepID=UPI001F3AF76B|nr:hypothetical protein [Amycolatopsis sp. GM8]
MITETENRLYALQVTRRFRCSSRDVFERLANDLAAHWGKAGKSGSTASDVARQTVTFYQRLAAPGRQQAVGRMLDAVDTTLRGLAHREGIYEWGTSRVTIGSFEMHPDREENDDTA